MAEQALETKLGRLPEVAGVGRVDSSVKTQHLLKGLAKLSTSLADFGKATKARQVQNDIITARTAFAVNKELPDNLNPEAEIAYNDLVAEKETRQFFRLLQDDAEVFGNGLLTDDDNYPDHTSKQAAYSEFIDQSVQTFYGQAQFNETQQQSILATVNDKTNLLKNAYTLLNAKDIKAQKLNDSAQSVQESIFEGISRLKMYDTFMAGHELTLQDFFTPEWHDELQKKILFANPALSKDEADLMIIQQLDLLASDPDNPQPDLLEYLTAKRKGGKPRFSSIQTLTAKIKTAQNSARSAFIAHSNAIDARETAIQKRNQLLASSGSMKMMLEEVSKEDGEKDLVKLEAKISAQFPHLKSSDLRAVINHADTLMKASGLGDPGLMARMEGEASRGELSITQLEADSRAKKLNRQQYLKVLAADFNFRNGAVTRNRTAMNDNLKTIRNDLLSYLKNGSELGWEGQKWTAKGQDIHWNDQTGRYEGFSPRITTMIDRIVLQYEQRIHEIEDDPDNADIVELKKQMQLEKQNLFKTLGMLEGPLQPVRTEEATKAKNYRDQAISSFDAEVQADDSSIDPDTLVWNNKPPVPRSFDPLVHQAVPPSKIRIIKDADNKLQAIIKARTAATGATTFDDTGVTQFAMEGISEKDISSAKPIRPTPLGVPDTGPSAILKDQTKTQDTSDIAPKPAPVLGTPKERAAAFEKASPDRPPSERVKLRELQDTAKFQSEENIVDFLKKTFKKLNLPSDLEASVAKEFDTKDLPLVTFLIEQEGFSKVAEDVGDGKVTSGVGLTGTGRKLGEKVRTPDAVRELKKRLKDVYLPYLNNKIEPKLPFKLTDNQKIALVSLFFNVGEPAFNKSRAFKALKAGNIDIFKREAFSKPHVYKGKKYQGFVFVNKKFSRGLYLRRQRELKLWDK